METSAQKPRNAKEAFAQKVKKYGASRVPRVTQRERNDRVARNAVTGDRIRSRAATPAYRDNYDRIFGGS